jgi:hypothetical protein
MWYKYKIIMFNYRCQYIHYKKTINERILKSKNNKFDGISFDDIEYIIKSASTIHIEDMRAFIKLF